MKKDRIMILVQTVVIIAAGFFSGDSAFALINSGIGVVFIFYVCDSGADGSLQLYFLEKEKRRGCTGQDERI